MSENTLDSSQNNHIPFFPPISSLQVQIPHSRTNPYFDPTNSTGADLSSRKLDANERALHAGHLSQSVDSFITACSSPININPSDILIMSGPGETPGEQAHMQPSPTMRSLPKSLSVDSFVREQQQRDVVGTSPSEPLRSAGNSKSHSRLSSIDPSLERWRAEQQSEHPVLVTEVPPLPSKSAPGPGLRTLVQRVKRHSRHSGPQTNISEDDIESSPYEDSEFEQGHSGGGKLSTRVMETRRRVMAPKRSGSVPVQKTITTSQTRNRKSTGVGAHPPLANINTSISAVSTAIPENSPPLRSKTSAPTPLDSTRARSRSIGTQSDDSSVKKPNTLLVDAETPPKDAIQMSLVIVGSRGCGKSTFIRRAWKNSRTSEQTWFTVSATDSNGTRVIHYTSRKAFMQAHEGRDYFLTLIEISTQELEHVDGEIHGDVWPSILPKIDGAFVLYDASDRSSFIHVEELISGYYASRVPYIVLACKSDLPHRISPADSSAVVAKYDGGIVEISNNEAGRDKTKRCVGVLLRGVRRIRWGEVDPDHNPCSPGLYNAPAPWEINPSPSKGNESSTSGPPSSLNTPTSATVPTGTHTTIENRRQPPPPQIPLGPPPPYRSITALAAATALPTTPPITGNASPIGMNAAPNPPPNPPPNRAPSAPTSPTRARSMGDMINAHQKSVQVTKQARETEPELNRSKSIVDLTRTSGKSTDSIRSIKSIKSSGAGSQTQEPEPAPIIPVKKDLKQSPPGTPYLTIEDLLEKLFFLSCSGNDPSFISHFFLTYRRFTTPRRILLAMQKRMLELNQPSNDYTLAAYAQLRICTLLEQWIHDYPSDFAVPGTSGALQALIRQILRQPHTLYYGSDFLPFLEILPTLQDQDSAWAVKIETMVVESDESDSNYESDVGYEAGHSPITHPTASPEQVVNTSRPVTRERKSSIPLSAKNFLQGNLPGTIRTVGSISSSPRDFISKLIKASNGILHVDSEELAREITRRELDLYMKIEPRDWLRHTLVSGKKDPSSDRIARFNASYNELHDWAASMILCHDKSKSRARVVEKLAEVAVRLRNLNNYSGLRAIITAINQSTYPNDEVMEIFKQKTELHKKYLSSDILMRTSGAHQSYRMALKNTKGPCIPCLEIHTSDLRRAHEGNPDHKPDDPTKIHWAKFNMIGKFVGTTTQLQNNCRGQHGYSFTENPHVGQYFDVPVMDYDMQQDRLGPPPDDDGDGFSTPLPPALALDHSGHSRDAGIVKRILFWTS